MGQGSSRGTGSSSERQRPRSTLWPRSTSHASDHSSALETQPRARSRPQSFNPFGIQPPVISSGPSSGVDGGLVRRRSRLTRARSTLTTSMPNIFRRHSTRPPLSAADPLLSPTTHSSSPSRPSPRHAASDGPSYFLPRIQMPDLSLDIDDLTPTPELSEPAARNSSRRGSLRSASNLSDRISSLRPDRGIRNLSSSLRRRRSPLRPGEDQAAMLSRLLSVAAAATAATLMGGDHRAVSQARSVAGDEEDGTFDSFLQSLQNGRIASALRQNGSERDNESDVGGRREAPINLFRMFRFGTSTPQRSEDTPQPTNATSSSDGDGTSGARSSEGGGQEGRMVPIIIVGIRSITPGSGRVEDDTIPPFLDALSTFPTPLDSPSEANLNNFLRQPHNGTRFSHRRRASMGGLSTFPSGYDNQRHSRTNDRPRPWSTISDTPPGPRPPPSTPATPGLSAFSSGTTTPTTAQPSMLPGVQSSATSRRESFLRRTAGTGLGSTAEEPQSQSRTARQRRLSESDFTRFGSGSSRRNGVVGPDDPEEGSSEAGTRSWIIYVLGGSYPENHPILTTPSLFTDSPTYEDMLLLSSLLGPAKPPVASEDDVASAPGLFRIRRVEERLVAVAIDNDEIVPILPEERCLVCLSDFELEEEARRLMKCGHLFHRECIDQWLTTGRNSCPLCRGQGVDEKVAERSTTPDDPPSQPRQEVA